MQLRLLAFAEHLALRFGLSQVDDMFGGVATLEERPFDSVHQIPLVLIRVGQFLEKPHRLRLLMNPRPGRQRIVHLTIIKPLVLYFHETHHLNS